MAEADVSLPTKQRCDRTYSREAPVSFWLVDSLVALFHLLLRPGDEGNVVRSADLLTHCAHHGKERCRFHVEVVTNLPVSSSSNERTQDDRFFVAQGGIEAE